jgi:branched-subunit amino acid ABC-type transport system permease component
LIYRASRIINFAVGNMGVIGATLLSLLVVQYHVPFWVALPVALVTGLVLGAIVDATVIRRLRKSPRVVVLVATIGIARLLKRSPTSSRSRRISACTTRAPSTGPGRWPVCRCEDRTFRS